MSADCTECYCLAALARQRQDEAWQLNVRCELLQAEIDKLREAQAEWRHCSPPIPTCGECGAEISGNLYCLDCSNVTACETCGDREGGCPYCQPDAGWAK